MHSFLQIKLDVALIYKDEQQLFCGLHFIKKI